MSRWPESGRGRAFHQYTPWPHATHLRASRKRRERQVWARFRFAAPADLLERHLGEASQLARMEPLGLLQLQLIERQQAALEVLLDALAIEFAGHAGELDLAMQRLVGHGEQRTSARCHKPTSYLSLPRRMLIVGSGEPPPVSSEPASLIYVVVDSK